MIEVSVILPTYNRASFLKEALESLANQTFRNFEVLVVDDGSTDSTLNIIKSYESKINLHTLRFQENQGVSKARNWGIREAKGRWIAFLDSDDIWLPDKLKLQLEYLKTNPEMKICQTEEIWIRRGRHVNPMKKHQKIDRDVFERSLELCVVSPSATLIHRSLLEEVGNFDEELTVCEDYDLWLRISYQYPIGLLGTPLIVKRGGHTDQLSRKYPAMDRFRIRSLQKLLKNHPLTSHQRELVRRALDKKSKIYLEGAKKRGKLDEANAFLEALAQ